MNRSAARTAATRWTVFGCMVLGAWLLLAAVPVSADGGPHVASENSGATSLTPDSCAGCHRVHTAQAPLLLKAAEEDLCLTCHGAAVTGATTDVESGVQYAVGATVPRGDVVAGALRSGGFVQARIASDDPIRISYGLVRFGAVTTWQSAKVSELPAGEPVTSAHIAFDGTAVVAQGIAWGNGGLNSGVGPAFTTSCTTCHNPHGNGNYRILVPGPSDGSGPLVEGLPVPVTDAALPSGSGAAGVRNYTNIWGRTLGDVVAGTYPGGGTTATGGDYWRDHLPWDGVPQWNAGSGLPGSLPAGAVNGDRPMYVPNGSGVNANLTGFRGQITQWCSTCHTRHDGLTGATVDTGDSVYRFRHDVGQSECTQCHVAHGSNAAMPGRYSGSFTYPDAPGGAPAIASGSSRLLKIDNRGTCQACHDPTYSVGPQNIVTDPTP